MKALLLLVAFFSLAVSLLHAAPRVALVIGNNTYRGLPAQMQLTSPVNDAQDMTAALQKLGYTIVGGRALVDATREQITAATEQFTAAARDAEAAVFYFSGHGIQVGEDNYILPTDTPSLTGISVLNNRAVMLRNSVMVALEEADAKTKVIILDCCRDNPFAAQLQQALAQVGKSLKTKGVGEITGYGPGFYLAFATSPGQTAADGNGKRNSPFTAAMLQAMPTAASKDIDFFFRDVKALLPDDQVSWTNHSIKSSFSLVPGKEGAAERMINVPRHPLEGVSKAAPFRNSLGMSFVPAGTPGLLFSVWETRVMDFEAFVEQSGHDAINPNNFGARAFTLEKTSDGKGAGWALAGGSWRNPRFPVKQSADHPVVCVSYLDAEAFCAWLTQKERANGKIPQDATYRLPTDGEWSRACGAGEFPWGEHYPPRTGDGNYCGLEAMVGPYQGFTNDLVKAGFKDNSARTAPVGMFTENRFGLHDMGGNVEEWCATWYTADLNDAETKEAFPGLKDDQGGNTYRVLRGASWYDYGRVFLRSSCRNYVPPMYRSDNCGFRCVLVVGGG